LGELRERARRLADSHGTLSVSEVVADVKELHANIASAGALFQVASQFNLLEMTSYEITPEDGIGRYENDPTQGPACAISCGAGTIFRNYFAPVNGRIGQSRDNQIDCLKGLGNALGNVDDRLWKMTNGYILASREGLMEISRRMEAAEESELNELRSLLRIGVQSNTQVTLRDCSHAVTQAYCSALPVGYNRHPLNLWEGFARLVLEAAYEATLCAALLNSMNTGNRRVYLTLLGGGAFGNESEWILDAIRRSLLLYKKWNLEVGIVSYGASKPAVRKLATEFSS